MKRPTSLRAAWLCALAVVFGVPAPAANLPSDWRREQPFAVATSGLMKISLPVETLDAARPGLEDLRLYDDAGNEVPYVIERLLPRPKVVQRAKSFQVSLGASTTVITIETGLAQPVDGVTLETPASGFIKAVLIEGSSDGRSWQTLARGQPVFRQPSGVGHLHLSFPPAGLRWLRLTVDDQRSLPVPVTGALVFGADAEPVPTEWMLVGIAERDENPGETRLALSLGAANLSVASVQIETGEPLFTRRVTLAVPEVSEDAVREQTVGQGVVYRVAVEGQPASSKLSVPLENLVRSRELLLLIQNDDSPPLPVTAVRVERRPVYLAFLARAPGAYHLLAGNSHCAAPRYDLAALGMNLQSVPVLPFKLPPPSDNPNYHSPEVLPRLDVTGAPLDVSEWQFRKPVIIASTGAQQVELDLDVLAHAGSGLASLRLLHASNQVPYILETTSISRAITPVVTATNDVKNPKLSRWIIKFPRPGLPLTRITCAARTPLFQRQVLLYEELADERGAPYRHALGGNSWSQTPERKSKEFSLMLNDAARGDTLILELDNGDNPPIELDNFRSYYPVTRLLFKSTSADRVSLYYGNPRTSSPRYDLSLVTDQLLSADKKTASLAAEERLKSISWREKGVPAAGGVVFLGILVLVVLVLLVIISRLLPKPELPAK